ncbi:TPA: glycosyltransferase family 2 protein, partial [Klebsiella pneumoniae]|nr:glycosyltransferase family 2 protein [Klebsiella pneumoniae]
MENPFFSVIVPMHNNSKTINLTLDSLKKQTFTSFEVIFVDDASDDFSNTEKIIIDSLSGKVPFTIVRHIENKNGAAARNLGITLARGEYIAFLDA